MACVKLNETEDNLIKAREELRKHEEKINSLENKLLHYHTWKIGGFNAKVTLAERYQGRSTTVDSAPFYTDAFGRYGYKFKMRLYVGKPTYLSIYGAWTVFVAVSFVIMKGEYDFFYLGHFAETLP